MKLETLFFAIPLALSLAGTAAADEPRTASARRAGILAVMDGPRVHLAYAAPALERRAPAEEGSAMSAPAPSCGDATCDARGTVSFARPLLRSVGACDADALAVLADEIGRLGAIERCTGHGEVGATTRPLHRPMPASAFAATRDVESDPLAGLELGD